MTFEQILELLQSTNEKINQFTQLAKKIHELPEQSILDLSSKIHVSRAGISEYIEIQKLYNAIIDGTFNGIVFINGTISVSGLTVTVPPITWKISGVQYQILNNTEFVFQLCEDGFSRIDIIVADNGGNLYVIEGMPSETIAVRPDIPINAILVTQIYITDSAITDPTDPIIGSQFIKKEEYYETNIYTPGEITVKLDTPYTSFVLLSSDIIKVLGTNPTAEYLNSIFRTGKKISFVNLTANNISFKHSLGANGFRFPTNSDFTLRPKDKLIFNQVKRDVVCLELDCVNWVDVVTSEEFANVVERLEEVLYKTVSSNTIIDDSFHRATIWVTANCNITIPTGLRPDFTCNLKTFSGVTATYLTSGTVINSQSDGTIQAEKSMAHLATFSLNNFILMGGGLS